MEKIEWVDLAVLFALGMAVGACLAQVWPGLMPKIPMIGISNYS